MRENPITPILDNRLFLDDLMYSAALMRKCSFIIGNDCGGLHLATLAGCPVVGIYGPTNPIKSGPLGERNVVIYKGLSCLPCKWFRQQCKINRRCLEEITPEEVTAAAKFILDKGIL